MEWMADDGWQTAHDRLTMTPRSRSARTFLTRPRAVAASRRLATPILAAAAVAAVAAAASFTMGAGAPAQAQSARASAPPGQPASPIVADADRGRIAGSESARVWVLIVSDFQCPFCRQWHRDTWETLRREYVATGKVRVAFMNYPLGQHPNARPAAVAAMCASAQGRFWQFTDLAFAQQDRWKDLGDPRAFFDGLSRSVGVDLAKAKLCAGDPGIAALVDADYTRMSRAGAQSTPTFFIGRSRIEGAQPITEFRRVIDAELAAARPR